jgi:hypothetical protein
MTLAVPRKTLTALAAGVGASESEFLRRLIADHVPSNDPPSAGKFWWLWKSVAAVLVLAAFGKLSGTGKRIL